MPSPTVPQTRKGPLRLVLITVLVAVGALAIPTAATADETREKQWHLTFLKAEQLHRITKGRGVTVAVVDTGVDAQHRDLSGNVAEGADFTPPAAEGDGRLDLDGHGTAMASLIAGHGHGSGQGKGALGLAPAATILPVRVQARNLGRSGDSSAAITWAVDHGAQVINISAASAGVEEAVNYALNRDVVVVASAGNTTQGATSVDAPARYPGVIAVSGTGRDGGFSDVSVRGPEVVVAAPAVDIMAAGAGERGSYAVSAGTSDSAAIVSGVVALIRAKYPKLDAPSVIKRLIDTAHDKGPKGRDDRYGFGVVDPLKALMAKVPEVDENPLISDGSSPAPSHSYTGPPLPGAEGGNGPRSSGMSTTLVAALVLLALITAIGATTAMVMLMRRRSRAVVPQLGPIPPSGTPPNQPPNQPPSGSPPPG